MKDRGYTTAELAVVLIIIGVLIIFLSKGYLFFDQSKIKKDAAKIANLSERILHNEIVYGDNRTDLSRYDNRGDQTKLIKNNPDMIIDYTGEYWDNIVHCKLDYDGSNNPIGMEEGDSQFNLCVKGTDFRVDFICFLEDILDDNSVYGGLGRVGRGVTINYKDTTVISFAPKFCPRYSDTRALNYYFLLR